MIPARSRNIPASRKLLSPTISARTKPPTPRSEEHTSELQSRSDLVCRLLLEKKKQRDAWMTGTQSNGSKLAITLSQSSNVACCSNFKSDSPNHSVIFRRAYTAPPRLHNLDGS